MTYSTDFRERALGFHEEGHSMRKTSEVFDVHISTIKSWKKLKRETGTVKQERTRNTSPRIYHKEALEQFIDNNPFCTGIDLAKEFGGSPSGATRALKRYNISLKE